MIFFIAIELACQNKHIITYSWDILQFKVKEIVGLGLEKHSDYLTGLGLTLWCIRFGLEKYLDYLSELWLILYYVGLGVEKYLDYLTFMTY